MSDLNFVWPLSGGLLIGLSAALYLLLNGRIAGISGLTASAFGLARLSPRSMAATATFMIVAATTVLALRHIVGGL